MKKLFLLVATLFSLNMGLALAPLTHVGAVDVISPACQTQPDAAPCGDDNPGDEGNNSIFGPNGLITRIIQILVIIVGITSIIVIMISSVRLATSGGNAESATTARKGIIYAIVGLIIALFAQAIVSFVLSKL